MSNFNRKLGLELVIFLGFLGLAVASRFWLADVPNFKPVAACALLSGFLFSRIWLALALPILVMLISDWQIGAYEIPIMLAVYGSLAACPLLGFTARRLCRARSFRRSGQTAVVMSSAVLMSVLFFVTTNLVVWTQWYDFSWQGLVMCFVAALPFFKFTLLGNVLFTMGGLASYWFASDLIEKRSSATSTRNPIVECTRIGCSQHLKPHLN